MDTNRLTLRKISTLKNLPTLPHILVKLIRLCSESEVNLRDISTIIEKDPSLSGKVLKLINSSYYGLPRRIESLYQAVGYLGVNAVKNIAVSSSICQSFHPARRDGIFNLKVFWGHSLKCAVLARLLAKEVQYNDPEIAFLAGLLHDIGRLVLWVNFTKEYSELLKQFKGRSDLIFAGEIRMGVTHCEVGSWLLRHWSFQSFVADSVLYHHDPLESIQNALPLVQIVYSANLLSQKSAKDQKLDHEVVKQLYGFDDSRVRALLLKADGELEEVARSLDIEIETTEDEADVIAEKDRKIQEVMVREVRDTSLLLGTLQNLIKAHDKQTILKEIYQGLQILFDAKKVMFFSYDPEKNALVDQAVMGDYNVTMVRDLIIPLKATKSLLVTALIRGKAVGSFSSSRGIDSVIIDAQIARFLRKEGIFCLPLIAHDVYVGVIVIGLDETEFAQMSKLFKVLDLFANHVALALYANQAKEIQAKKVQSERLMASAVIARKMAHEINNPLSIMKNYLSILGMKLVEQDIAQDEIRILNEEIDRIGGLLKVVRTFSEDSDLSVRPVNINSILSDIVKVTRDAFLKDGGIEIHLDLDETLPTVMTDKNALKQIIINLMKNAAEAMSGGGNLHLGTNYIANRFETVGAENAESHGYAEVFFRDDGPGIPEEIKNSLFEPFVSAKSGGHSGLGLSVVHNLVQALGGTITCESEKGRGTTFKVCFPMEET